ncbi:hypothetical protein D3C71_1680220 [compost metagenome]
MVLLSSEITELTNSCIEVIQAERVTPAIDKNIAFGIMIQIESLLLPETFADFKISVGYPSFL